MTTLATDNSINVDRIPAELRELNQWLDWRNEQGTKVPYQPNKTGRKASSTDQDTWGTFEDADAVCSLYAYDGIGFAVTPSDDYCGIDLDHCVIDDKIDAKAQAVIDSFDSYTERTPNDGTRIWIKGKKPDGVGCRKTIKWDGGLGQIEVYDQDRYFTVTGHHVDGTPTTIEDRQTELDSFCSEYLSKSSAPKPNPKPANNGCPVSDDQVLDKARSSKKNGERFSRLFDHGDYSDYPTQSEADLALCNHLAFYVGADPSRIANLFRQSGLHREKFDRPDYWQRTVTKAIEGKEEFYDWNGNGHRKSPVRGAVQHADDYVDVNDAIKQVGLTQYLAEGIQETDHFACDAGRLLYVYQDGVYVPIGKAHIKKRCKKLLRRWGLTDRWTKHRTDEVVEYISVDCPQLWSQPSKDVVNVANGLLDVVTCELMPHDPNHLTSVQLAVEYDPDATCPNWEAFVADVFPSDCLDLAWEIIAWLMTPDNDKQLAVLLLGSGANGKSTLLNAWIKFLGRSNIAAIPLQRLESDKFAASRLVGKLVNICPDLPSDRLVGTSTFKAITGQDILTAERKFAESFEFEPFCRMVFSANHPPQSRDASEAFFRRWLVIPFNRTFTDEDMAPRDELNRQLHDPKELSGVLKKALAALTWVRERGFTTSNSVLGAAAEFREMTDPLAVWLEGNTTIDSESHVVKDELRKAYNRHATNAGYPTLSVHAFTKSLRRIRPSLGEKKKSQGNTRKPCWTGIGLVQ